MPARKTTSAREFNAVDERLHLQLRHRDAVPGGSVFVLLRMSFWNRYPAYLLPVKPAVRKLKKLCPLPVTAGPWIWLVRTDAERDYQFLAGGGEMGALMRAKNWSETPLGPLDDWPQSLRTAVSICLNCSFPILIWWGPDLVKLYNDAYATILGNKHPQALGQRDGSAGPRSGTLSGRCLDGCSKKERRLPRTTFYCC